MKRREGAWERRVRGRLRGERKGRELEEKEKNEKKDTVERRYGEKD